MAETPTPLTDDSLINILELARFAPSVHNTQPWRVKKQDNELIVSIDPEFKLIDGDPTGRQTFISLGIFAEALDIAAQTIGLECKTFKLTDARLSLRFKSKSSNSLPPRIELLKSRVTDRSIYKSVEINRRLETDLKACASSDQIQIHVVRDPDKINKIADLTSRGVRLALSNPAFRQELSRYLLPPWSRKKRGISIRSLYLHPWQAAAEPLFMKFGWGLSTEASLEKKRWESASAVVFITGGGDMPDYWLEAGRTYLRVSLAIEAAGLAQATSASTVEASTFHEDIEAILNTEQRLLAALRLGAGSPNKEYSPRVEATELLK